MRDRPYDDDRMTARQQDEESARLRRERNATLETGCYFDSHRGHYIVPAVIDLAIEHGYIVDPFVQFALARYEDWNHDADYPQEALIEVMDDAIGWLNGDGGTGLQKPPPEIPEGTVWMWNDGDFGLYEEGDLD